MLLLTLACLQDPAVGATVRVTLTNGERLDGRLAGADDGAIALEVEAGRIILKRARIRSMEAVEIPPTPEPEPEPQPVPVPPADLPPGDVRAFERTLAAWADADLNARPALLKAIDRDSMWIARAMPSIATSLHEAAFEILTALPEPEAALLALTASDDASIGRAAVEWADAAGVDLGRAPALLRSERPELRRLGLRRIADGRDEAPLDEIARLAADPDLAVRIEAIGTISVAARREEATARGAEMLLDLFARADGEERRVVLAELIRLGDVRSLARLSADAELDPETRRTAAGAIRDGAVLAERIAAEEDAGIARALIESARRAGAEDVLDALIAKLGDVEVGSDAHAALTAITRMRLPADAGRWRAWLAERRKMGARGVEPPRG